MKQIARKTLSLLLTLSLLWSLALPAAASEALGEDLAYGETVLNRGTRLTTGRFWSSAFSDLRTEHFITYEPNSAVTPLVTYGSALTEQHTVSEAAKALEGEGHRVVAGLNGDYYNVTTGLPIGLVVTEGILRSSDAGHHAVGFRADGTAVLGKPMVKAAVSFGYVDDGMGTLTEMVRQIAGINKARVSAGGIYLYTYDFNNRRTTGTTEPGVDVVCSVKEGTFAIGETLTLQVEQVLETTAATAIGKDWVVLSANLLSDPYYVDALRTRAPGDELTLTLSAADPAWNEVEYAVGALYSLVENGAVTAGLPTGSNPRTAIGQKADGTLVFYTVDGRRSGHSIGASMAQVAQRLLELDCVRAVCLDGGGSTTLAVTQPGEVTAKTVNTPSGAERAVSNQIFLVAQNRPSGTLSHFHVSADSQYVLAGSRVEISAAAVDTNYIPMQRGYTLSASAGTLSGNVLTTPAEGGEITVTADGSGKSGSTTVYAVPTPDALTVRSESGTALASLTLNPGSQVALAVQAYWNHLPLKADSSLFTWTVEGNIGTMDADGVFTVGVPGTGSITVAAGEKRLTIPVTVSRLPLQTLEDFEGETALFDGEAVGLTVQRISGEAVKLGRKAVKLDYVLEAAQGYEAFAAARMVLEVSKPYTSVNLWVHGDGSGNLLSFLCDDGTGSDMTREITTLDFTGWRQVTVPTGGGSFRIRGLKVTPGSMTYIDDGLGGVMEVYPDTPTAGTVSIDHMTASFEGTVDTGAPEVKVEPVEEEGILKGNVTDGIDGILPEISVTWDGGETEVVYNRENGSFTTSIASDGRPHRITVTAKDASGNIGRASYDVPVSEDWTPRFSDTQGYWAAAYVDFLYDQNVTTGYADGTFRPNQNITRAQFAAMLYRYLELDEDRYAEVELPFADLESIPDYAIPAVKALYTEGIINGSAGRDGALYFNPNGSLTRAQASAMIGRTQEKGYAAAELTFTDANSIPAYATDYIRTMAAQGILGGYADGTFKPNNPITRGQMAKILYNLI